MSDDELDRYLSGDSDLSQLYRQARDKRAAPAAETEQAILAAARRELQTAPQSPHATAPARVRFKRWAIPTSVAATLLLSTSLYLTQQPELPSSKLLEQQVPGTPSPTRKKATLESNRTELREAPQTRLLEAEQAMPAEQGSAKISRDNRDQARQQQLQSAPSDPPVPSPSVASPTMIDSLSAQQEASVMAEEPTLPDSTPAAAAAAADFVKPEQDYRDQPELWLSLINELIKANKRADAQDHLAAFRLRHPTYPIPEALQQLLTGESDRE